MKTSDLHFDLPPELIAQEPLNPRDASRLFVCKANNPVPDPAAAGEWFGVAAEHLHFRDLPRLLEPGDVLVFNDSKVFPARLFGTKETGGKIEILLLEPWSSGQGEQWTALLKPGKGSEGTTITFSDELKAQVVGRKEEVFTLQFNKTGAKLNQLIDRLGVAPTPPYIKNAPGDLGKYQTVYAKERGSAAAPTAGFHFTKKLLEKLKQKGGQFEYVTLHVGLGTFQPVKEEEAEEHKIHTERYSIDSETWQRIKKAKEEDRRVIAVGTTSCRVLETLGNQAKPKLAGETDIYILPGHKFKIIDSLITNFHLPESTLLMLVTAFIGDKLNDKQKGIDETKRLYSEAIKEKYRFYSFGDAMLIQALRQTG